MVLDRLTTGKSAQATGTDLDPLPLSIEHHALALDVRTELALGCHLGVADVVTERRPFATNLTFCHFFTSLFL
jgi:hypothetical protein